MKILSILALATMLTGCKISMFNRAAPEPQAAAVASTNRPPSNVTH